MVKQTPGSTLVVIMIVTSLFLVMLAGMSTTLGTLQAQSRRVTSNFLATTLADGGMNYTIAKLRANSGYTGETYTENDWRGQPLGEVISTITGFDGYKRLEVKAYVPNDTSPTRVCRLSRLEMNNGSQFLPKTTLESSC